TDAPDALDKINGEGDVEDDGDDGEDGLPFYAVDGSQQAGFHVHTGAEQGPEAHPEEKPLTRNRSGADVPANERPAEESHDENGGGGGSHTEARDVPEGAANPGKLAAGVRLRVCPPKGGKG